MSEEIQPIDHAYQRLVAAIDGEPAGGEAAYLARLVLLMFDHAGCEPAALALIEAARTEQTEGR